MSALTDRLRNAFKRDGHYSRTQREDFQTFFTNFDLAEAATGAPAAVTATTDGLTTGLIPASANLVTITSSVATKQVSLPAVPSGKVMQLLCAANGCELISAVAAHKVNNVVVGATNEAALVAGTLYTLRYDGANNWVMTGLTNAGAVETPVIPDAR